MSEWTSPLPDMQHKIKYTYYKHDMHIILPQADWQYLVIQYAQKSWLTVHWH